jgi:heat shock protein HslJ
VPKNVTLTIDHGKLTTSDGCNGIGGRAEVVDGELVAGAWAITQIGCGNPTTQTVIGRVIANGAKLQVVGPTLTVNRAGVGALTYQWQPQDDQSTDPGRFASTAWRLVSLAGDPAPAGVSIRLTNKTALTLDVGCARYTGTATIGHGTLTTTGLPQDVGPNCPSEASTLLSFLTSPATLWSIQDGKLLVYGGNAQAFSAVFAPEDRNAVAQEPAQAIVGPTWTLTAVEQTSGNSASGHSTTVHVAVRFQAKARITVAERCARLAGPVTLRDHDMDIGRLQPTEVVKCPMIATNLRREEETTLSDVHRVLSGRATWHIHGNQLTLTKGGTTLTFESS